MSKPVLSKLMLSERERERVRRRDAWGDPEARVVAEGDEATVGRASAARTRRSFLVGGLGAAAGYGMWHWINNSPPIGRLQAVLRRSLLLNARFDRALFDERGLAPEYPLSEAVELRLNGVVGLEQTLVPGSYRLQVAGVANAKASPHYVPDVTAWNYEYGGEMPETQQSTDVKSAPGNDEDDSKTGGKKGKSGAPKEQESKGQESKGQGSAAGASPPGALPRGASFKGASSRDVSARSSNASEPGAAEAPAAVPGGGSPSAPGGLSIADRFNRMAQAITHKRYQGDGEAGASYSSLDIGTPGLLVTMAELAKLPKVETVLQFKCVEGWSQITQWGGYRLRDFLEAYPPERIKGREPRYVYMETPDGNYYAGYNMSAARHPQSLLVTEMGGQPLTQHHGAPLRLYMPIKYGYKQLKRIGLIAYTDNKPDDYWTKLGYDWYAGL